MQQAFVPHPQKKPAGRGANLWMDLLSGSCSVTLTRNDGGFVKLEILDSHSFLSDFGNSHLEPEPSWWWHKLVGCISLALCLIETNRRATRQDRQHFHVAFDFVASKLCTRHARVQMECSHCLNV